MFQGGGGGGGGAAWGTVVPPSQLLGRLSPPPSVVTISRNGKEIPYSRKIWRELYLAKWPPSGQKKILAEFKFGDWQSRVQILLRHRVSYGGSPHVVRLHCEDRSRSHGRVSTRELCSRPSHIQEYVDSVVVGSTFTRLRGLTFDATLDLAFAFSRS